jgi:hypothetical protein
MKRILLAAVLAAAALVACATRRGKMSESRLNDLAARCTEENESMKPSTSRWHNLSSQERRKKRTELEDYRRDRIRLYQSLHDYTSIYTRHVDKDGWCRTGECASLAKHREIIMSGCPIAAEDLPLVRFQ